MNNSNTLHIVQGGVENGDRAFLLRADPRTRPVRWIVPKSVKVGDEVVIYIGADGLFATAKIVSSPKPRSDWPHRYGAQISAVRLIRPPISLSLLRRSVPRLNWSNYPRSITTLSPLIAAQVRALIERRRRFGGAELTVEALAEASLAELRRVALLKSRTSAPTSQRTVTVRLRSEAIKLYVLRRAEGHCEYCLAKAPFSREDGSPYLEPHHTMRLADEGPDHPAHVIGLCPNCHRRAHYSNDALRFKTRLNRRLANLEPRRKDR